MATTQLKTFVPCKPVMKPVSLCDDAALLPTELHYPPMPMAPVPAAFNVAANKQLAWVPVQPEHIKEVVANNTWCVCLPLRAFRPENITHCIVRDEDTPYVLIKCQRTENGQVIKDKRMVFIPRNVDLHRITVTVTRDCCVIIRAPCSTNILDAKCALPEALHNNTAALPLLAQEELLKKNLLKAEVPLECFEKSTLTPELAKFQEEMMCLRRELVPRGLNLIRLVRLPNREYELRLDFILTLFKPHEVKVTCQKRTILINCVRETKVWENEPLKITCCFEFPMPRCCDVERMTSVFKPTGCLRITLPCVFREELPLDGIIVPIKKA